MHKVNRSEVVSEQVVSPVEFWNSPVQYNLVIIKMATETDANPFQTVSTPVIPAPSSPPPNSDASRNCRVPIVINGDKRKFQERKHLPIDKFEYPRNGHEPGLILIFNQEKFNDPESKRRTGSRRDVNEIVICFQRQGFNVDPENIMTDFTVEEVRNKMSEVAASDLKEYNCLIVFFLTHGDEFGRLHVIDGTIATHEIWRPFSKCVSLNNKPKMFIFQACKGNDFTTTGASNSLPHSESTASLPVNTFSTSHLGSDMLIVYCTLEGNVGFRNPLTGSWFVQELCKNFLSYGKRDDVISLIVRTTKCVCGNYYFHSESGEYLKQMPMFVSTLTKKFYLNRNKDRALLLKMVETNEDILKEVKELKEHVIKLLLKDEDKKKKK
ncbi:caspase-7 [Leptinotarsa decemlineata]|uniref:caspase-7 n=1 Tax=Leptinotarsa decemlineata TaxID=7539 RepID=UPI003D30D4A2